MALRLRKRHRVALKRLPFATIGAALLLVSLVAAAGWWRYDTHIVPIQQANLVKQVQEQARQRALQVNRYVQQQQRQLERIATQKSAVNALGGGDEALDTALQSVSSYFSDVQSVRIFTRQRSELTTPSEKPLSYIEMHMLNLTERNRPPSPDVISVDRKRLLLLGATIKSSVNGAAQGSLLITIPTRKLFAIVATHPQSGKTYLQHRDGAQVTLIHAFGDSDTDVSASARVGSSNWHIHFTASSSLNDKMDENTLQLILICSVAALILVTLCVALGRKYKPASRRKKFRQKTAINDDIHDLKLADEDKDVLGLADSENGSGVPIKIDSDRASELADSLPSNIFRAYDIRGLAGSEISDELTLQIGQAIGTEALAANETSIFVARDGRNTSSDLNDQLVRGILSTGCHVINLGAAPSPLLYFAISTSEECNSGVVITASHNPAEFNGFKVVINGQTLSGERILKLKSRIIQGDVVTGDGTEQARCIEDEYIERIFSDVALANDVNIVVDAGNGITGSIAPRLLQELGCEVTPLYCDIDGDFPNHDPDPSVAANLQDLLATVKSSEADLGVAFDGDGDRLIIVTPAGKIISPDQLLMLFAKDIVSRHPGADVIFDVKCTRELNNLVRNYGGRPIMWKTGHSHMKAKMQETGAVLGGELSGHIFIKDRWYGFDDGMYACARLLEIMTLRDQDIDTLFDSFPVLPATPELKIEVPEEQKFAIIERLMSQGSFLEGKRTTLDGLRVDFAKGWGLVRASNTSAALTLRFEAESETVLTSIQQLFKRELLKVDSRLKLPF